MSENNEQTNTEEIEILYENKDTNNYILLPSLLHRMKSKQILRINYFHWNKFLNVVTGQTPQDVIPYRLTELHKIDVTGIKLIFMMVYHGLDVLPILRNAFPDIPILFFTLDYCKVYAREVSKEWIKSYKNPGTNVYTIDHGPQYMIEKYTNLVFGENMPQKNKFGFPGFANNYFANMEINTECKNKILFTGSHGSYIYKQREKFFNIFKSRSDCEVQTERYSHEKYMEYMKGFLAIYAGPVDWSRKWFRKGYKNIKDAFITTKFFEIPAIGALLVADDSAKDQLIYYGFINMRTCVYINLQNYDERIKWILDPENREKVDNIRTNGHKMVNKLYTEQKILPLFHKIIEKITGCSVVYEENKNENEDSKKNN